MTLTSVATAVSLLLGAGCGELIARLTVGPPIPNPLPQIQYEPHARRRFTMRPGQTAWTLGAPAHIDSTGFRLNGATRVENPSHRIFALGDSFTFGYGVADDETWPAQLERMLNACEPGSARVVNGGTISYDTHAELDYVRERAPAVRPQIVVHALYWNDYIGSKPPNPREPPFLTRDGYFIWADPTPSPTVLGRTKTWLKNHSTLALVAKQALDIVRGGADSTEGYPAAYRRLIRGELDTASMASLEQFYRDLRDLGGKQGFATYALILPVRDIVELPQPTNHPYPRLVRQILDRAGVPYVDGIALWDSLGRGRETFLLYDEHLNAESYRVLAHAIQRRLAADGILAANGGCADGPIESH